MQHEGVLPTANKQDLPSSAHSGSLGCNTSRPQSSQRIPLRHPRIGQHDVSCSRDCVPVPNQNGCSQLFEAAKAAQTSMIYRLACNSEPQRLLTPSPDKNSASTSILSLLVSHRSGWPSFAKRALDGRCWQCRYLRLATGWGSRSSLEAVALDMPKKPWKQQWQKRFRRRKFARQETFVEKRGKDQDDTGQLPRSHCVRISYVGPSINLDKTKLSAIAAAICQNGNDTYIHTYILTYIPTYICSPPGRQTKAKKK